MVKSVDEALNAPASELMSAASSPATTIPRSPLGMTCCTRSGNEACAADGTTLPAPSTRTPSSGTRPVRANASAIMPGTMKMNTGSSLRNAAKIVPRRASRSFGAPSVRWTMY